MFLLEEINALSVSFWIAGYTTSADLSLVQQSKCPNVQMSKALELSPADLLTSSLQNLLSLQCRGRFGHIVVRAREQEDRDAFRPLKVLFGYQQAIVVVEHSLPSTAAGQVFQARTRSPSKNVLHVVVRGFVQISVVPQSVVSEVAAVTSC
jgi:hypothetical protein